jgi:hypothetical protein
MFGLMTHLLAATLFVTTQFALYCSSLATSVGLNCIIVVNVLVPVPPPVLETVKLFVSGAVAGSRAVSVPDVAVA